MEQQKRQQEIKKKAEKSSWMQSETKRNIKYKLGLPITTIKNNNNNNDKRISELQPTDKSQIERN